MQQKDQVRISVAFSVTMPMKLLSVISKVPKILPYVMCSFLRVCGRCEGFVHISHLPGHTHGQVFRLEHSMSWQLAQELCGVQP